LDGLVGLLLPIMEVSETQKRVTNFKLWVTFVLEKWQPIKQFASGEPIYPRGTEKTPIATLELTFCEPRNHDRKLGKSIGRRTEH